MNIEALLAPLGLDSYHLIDIGARWGPDPRWRAFGDRLHVFAFEPDEQDTSLKNLQRDNSRFTLLPYALADKEEQLTINFCRQAGCSSVFPPNHAYLNRFPMREIYEVVRRGSYPARTLDAAMEMAGSPRVDFAKLDIQGYELACLRGGTRTLETACGLEIEVEFEELYQGQPLFADVDAYVRGRGFTLMGLRRSHWRRGPMASPGRIVFADALYLRDPLAGKAGNADLARLVATALVYRRYEFALELLEHAGARVPGGEAVRAALEASIAVHRPGRLSRLAWSAAGSLERAAARLRRRFPPKVHFSRDDDF